MESQQPGMAEEVVVAEDEAPEFAVGTRLHYVLSFRNIIYYVSTISRFPR